MGYTDLLAWKERGPEFIEDQAPVKVPHPLELALDRITAAKPSLQQAAAELGGMDSLVGVFVLALDN
ncbi:MAG: hypothetical protein DRO40_07910 [Thermoprotei archaeon]|nr:MAG: hypothetical protein DRO40_07910 [Thermoprotei archaeon]